jgi:hypothetical protein
MTVLTQYTIQQAYGDYLTTANTGATVGNGLPVTIPQPVQDGLGNSSPLQLSQQAVNITGTFQLGGVAFQAGFSPRTAVVASPYVALQSDSIIGVNFAGAVAITLPAAAVALRGKIFVITDESGNAVINNITIHTAGGNINGAATALINTDYGSLQIYCSGTAYFIFGSA